MWKMGIVALLCAMSLSVMAADAKVKPGDAAPDVGGKDENGADLKLSSFKDKSGVVLFFFPKADTPGCTVESCGFRDEVKAFTDKGYALIGASCDAPDALKAFKEKHKLAYTFLSDPDATAAGAFGFAKKARNTVVIGKDGKIEQIYMKVTPATHPKEVFEKLGKVGN